MKLSQEKQLIKIAQSKNAIAAEAAMEQLLAIHSGLVKSIANKFTKYEIEYEDLYLCGQLGLIKAIKTYNLKSTNKLITYAYLWIVQAIQRCLDDKGIIYIPSKQQKLSWSIVSFKQEYFNTHRCYPSVETIAKALKITKNQVIKNTKVINQVYSLDKTIDPEEKQTSASTVADESANPSEIAIQEEALEQLYACLKKSLDPRQYQVISWTYGLDKDTGKLQAKEIAKRLNLSIPAVRKIQYATIALLRQVKELSIINESMQ